MCGVIGLRSDPQEVSRQLVMGLMTLQHRGQDGAGILTFDGHFHFHRGLGLVSQVFDENTMHRLRGGLGIGHNRYATIGIGGVDEVQPFLLNFPFGLGMAHNGNILNTPELRDYLTHERHRRLFTQSDLDVMLNLFADEYSSKTDITKPTREALQEAVGVIMDRCIGSFSTVGMVGGLGIIGFRDPSGIRPLFLGIQGNRAGLASEAKTLQFLGFDHVSEVQPGELILIPEIHEEPVTRISIRKPKQPTPCMFEWVYFSGVDSQFDGLSVYKARSRLGANLAPEVLRLGLKPDMVTCVPDTSRTAAIALAETLHLPFTEALIRNRYISRTFILDTQDKREKAVHLKMSAVREVVAGKKVLVVDDSIVRGTTSKKIIDLIRQAGATEIYFASTCPPIRHPCFYGIDFPSPKDLVAAQVPEDKLAKEIGADAVIYQSLDQLSEALENRRTCKACITGEYPTATSSRFQKERIDQNTKGNSR